MSKGKKRRSLAKRNAEIERISVFGTAAFMSPLGLQLYADWFLKAAQSLSAPSQGMEPVRPFLVCHSIELALKAYLSLQGATMLELSEQPYGHNLEAILADAEQKKLDKLVSLTDEQRTAIRSASYYYEGKVFEYPAIGEALAGYPKMPDIDALIQTAAILVDSLRQPCLNA